MPPFLGRRIIMANANQVIVNGETILDLRSDTVTPETLQKGYIAHDKSGTKITGTLETSSSGGAKETWVLNETPDLSKKFSYDVEFISNGETYINISSSAGKLAPGQTSYNLTYKFKGATTSTEMYSGSYSRWNDVSYRKLIFSTPPTGNLLTWLQANGVKQPANLAVQPSKDVTVTSNGTTEITPDAPYDVMEKANVTVNVPTSGTQLSCVTDLGLLTFGYEVKEIRVNGTAHEYVQYTSNAFSVSESLSFFPEHLRYSICIPFPFPWHEIGGNNVYFESGFLYIWFTTDPNTEEISTTGAITMGANIFTLMPMDSFPAESMPEGTAWFINCVKLISLDEENGTSYQIRFTLSVQDTRKLGILTPPDLADGAYYLTTHFENVRGLLITYEGEME